MNAPRPRATYANALRAIADTYINHYLPTEAVARHLGVQTDWKVSNELRNANAHLGWALGTPDRSAGIDQLRRANNHLTRATIDTAKLICMALWERGAADEPLQQWHQEVVREYVQIAITPHHDPTRGRRPRNAPPVLTEWSRIVVEPARQVLGDRVAPTDTHHVTSIRTLRAKLATPLEVLQRVEVTLKARSMRNLRSVVEGHPRLTRLWCAALLNPARLDLATEHVDRMLARLGGQLIDWSVWRMHVIDPSARNPRFQEARDGVPEHDGGTALANAGLRLVATLDVEDNPTPLTRGTHLAAPPEWQMPFSLTATLDLKGASTDGSRVVRDFYRCLAPLIGQGIDHSNTWGDAAVMTFPDVFEGLRRLHDLLAALRRADLDVRMAAVVGCSERLENPVTRLIDITGGAVFMAARLEPLAPTNALALCPWVVVPDLRTLDIDHLPGGREALQGEVTAALRDAVDQQFEATCRRAGVTMSAADSPSDTPHAQSLAAVAEAAGFATRKPQRTDQHTFAKTANVWVASTPGAEHPFVPLDVTAGVTSYPWCGFETAADAL